MAKGKGTGFIDPEADRLWAEGVDRVMKDAAAKGRLMEAEIPGYGRMGDLKAPQIEKMIDRLERAVRLTQLLHIDTMKDELARRDAATSP